MENLHRILQRQLKRTLGDPDSLPEPVQRFLQIVNETYHQADNDRKMLERSLEISAQEISQINSELQAVFQALPDLFLQLDRHGVILNLKNGNNPDYPWLAERFIGKSIAEFPLPHLAHQFDANRVTLREHHTSLTIEQNYTSGDKALFYEARFIPLLEDQTIIIVRDITERKLFEEEQVRLVTKLEEANRAKSQFLANISHEVRTPMNGVCGMLDLALETELNFEQRDYLATANNSARDMLAILNDLLDFSKIEAGKLELEKIEFNLYELIAQLVKQFAGTAHTKDLELAYWIGDNVPVFLIGDPVRLKQVLVNLIGNAIK
ncbi:MAG: PAS domain-containing protein, partial [Calditrichaeota bacterium]|nr:PAS domain-containing protein [Calditrichota bacterium]